MTTPFGSFPFDAAGVDNFSHPLFIGDWQRAPSVRDVYAPGTRIQDNSVSPPVIYETTGGGNWASVNTSGAFTNLTADGTVDLNTSGAGVTTIGTGGTGAVNIGNATGGTAITGDATVSGNLELTSAASYISLNGGAATDFIGTATLAAGTVDVLNTNIAAGDKIMITRSDLNASPALGFLVYTIDPGVKFTVDSLDATGAAVITDISIFDYVIFRQI